MPISRTQLLTSMSTPWSLDAAGIYAATLAPFPGADPLAPESLALAPEHPINWAAEMARVQKEADAALNAALKRVQKEADEALMAMRAERDDAKDEAAHVRHVFETQKQSQAARETQHKAEMMRRQIARRMMNSNLHRGWGAWKDLYVKRTAALRRLRQVAAHLHSPTLARAFSFWNWLLEQRRQLERERESAALEKMLEARLRQSQFEAGQLAMVKVAHEDEIEALKKQLATAIELAGSKEQLLQEAQGSLEGSLRYEDALEAANKALAAAAATRDEMAAALASHREKHETLLQRLLAEQRARLEEEVHNLKRQLAAKGDEHGGALQALKEQV